MARIKELIIITFLIFVCNAAKTQKLIYQDSITTVNIRLSPAHAMGGDFSDYIEDVQYFQLEKPSSGWINQISHGYSVDGKLILKDELERRIFIYNNDGSLIKESFLSKEDVKNNRINFNVDNKYMYVSNPMKQEYAISGKDGARYDLTGQLLQEFVLRTLDVNAKRIEFDYYAQLDSMRLYFMSMGRANFSKEDQVIVSQNQGITLPILKIDTLSIGMADIKPLSNGFYTSILDDKMIVYYSHGYTRELVELNNQGINKVYKFVFPLKNTPPDDLYDLPLYKVNGMKFFEIPENRELIYSIDNVIRYKDYLLFSLRSYSDSGFFTYSLKTKEFVNIKNLIPDESNGFLSILSRNNSKIFSDGVYLYSIIYAEEVNASIRDFYERDKRAIPSSIKDLSQYKNPILVRFKLK